MDVVTLLAVVFLAIACDSAHSDDTPDLSEFILDGARDIQRQSEDVSYVITTACPAGSTAEDLTAKFEDAGWAVLDRDPLLPAGDKKYLRDWQPVPSPPGEISMWWLGWFQKTDDRAIVMLSCPRPEKPDSPTDLEVAIHLMTTDDL